MKKYKTPSKSTKKCIEAGGAFTPSGRDYTPKPRKVKWRKCNGAFNEAASYSSLLHQQTRKSA